MTLKYMHFSIIFDLSAWTLPPLSLDHHPNSIVVRAAGLAELFVETELA
jgi:hypothetical protein